MGQATLEAFLSAAPRDDPNSRRVDPAANLACRAEQRPLNLVSCLAQRDCGLRTSVATKRSLQLQGCFPYQQVACMLPSSAAGHGEQSSITGLTVNQATGGVAWVQAKGLLHLSTMERLQQAARTCQQRAAEAAEAQQGQAAGAAERCSEAWQRSISEQQSQLAATHGCIQVNTACRVGTLLHDVAFDQGTSCSLALCGQVGPGSCITLLDMGKASPTYRRLTTSKQANGRMEAVKYLPPSHVYSIAASDSQSIFLWDLRRGATNTSELHTQHRLVCGVEPLPGSSLMCAVNELQQLMIWDLRKGSCSSSVKLLGASGPFQHALLCCRDLTAATTAAHDELCTQTGAPLGRPSGVQQVAAHPQDPSVLALQTTNFCTAVYRLGGDCVTHLAMAPEMFHPNTLSLPRKLQGRRGAWDAVGASWWSCATSVRPLVQGAALVASHAEVRLVPTLPTAAHSNQQPFPDHMMTDDDAGWPAPTALAEGAGAGRLYYRPGASMQYTRGGAQGASSLAELKQRAFAAARGVEGLGDAAAALQSTGAAPGELLVHPALQGGRGGGGVWPLWAAVRQWEDRRRFVFGPAVTPTSDWPTCFASYHLSDDMLLGTEGGSIAVLSPAS